MFSAHTFETIASGTTTSHGADEIRRAAQPVLGRHGGSGSGGGGARAAASRAAASPHRARGPRPPRRAPVRARARARRAAATARERGGGRRRGRAPIVGGRQDAFVEEHVGGVGLGDRLRDLLVELVVPVVTVSVPRSDAAEVARVERLDVLVVEVGPAAAALAAVGGGHAAPRTKE